MSDTATFGWLPAGTSQGDLDDGDFAWLSTKYKAGDESKSAGRKLPFKIHGKVSAAGWTAAWDRAHQSGTDFSGGPSQADVVAKLESAKPAGVKTEMSDDEPVSFSAELPASAEMADDIVLRTGKVFECGDYPDKSFSFDQADLAAAVAAFQPVPVDLEHVPTVLEGKLGQVRRIFAGADGTSLMGEVALPRWLDNVLEDGSRKVSATWNRATKQLMGLALVRNPRVSDAALMAAFSATEDGTNPETGTTASADTSTSPQTDFAKRHDTPTGQYAMQRIHDVAVANGAVCKAAMASRHEASAVQQTHDIAVAHGATCESGSMSAYPSGSFSATGRTQTPPTAPRRSHMSKFRQWVLGAAEKDGIKIDEAELAAEFASDGTSDEALTAALAKRDEEIATLKAAQEQILAGFSQVVEERRQAEAVTFCQSAVAGHRITPAAAEALVPLVARINASDSTANFAEGEPSSMALLEAYLKACPDLTTFTVESVKSDQAVGLFNVAKTPGVTGAAEADSQRVEAMLSATPEGRAVLATRKAAAS